MQQYPIPSTDSEQRPGLKPPQFTLATMLALVAVLAVALVALRAVGPLAAAAIVLAFLAVAAHILGNALGTRLRDQAPAPQEESSEKISVAQPHHFAPTTHLGAKHRMGWWMLLLSGGGALAGAYFGGNLLARLNEDQLTMANLTVAVVSCAVLGGLVGFAACSFARVFLQAWWQAHRSD